MISLKIMSSGFCYAPTTRYRYLGRCFKEFVPLSSYEGWSEDAMKTRNTEDENVWIFEQTKADR